MKLVQEHGRIEHMPAPIRESLGDPAIIEEARRIYLAPDVSSTFDIRQTKPDLDGLVRFLCDDHEFGRARVTAAIERTFREPRMERDNQA